MQLFEGTSNNTFLQCFDTDFLLIGRASRLQKPAPLISLFCGTHWGRGQRNWWARFTWIWPLKCTMFPLSGHWNYLTFSQSLWHLYPRWVTHFKHIFLSVLPIHYNRNCRMFENDLMNRIILSLINTDLAPDLKWVMDSFPSKDFYLDFYPTFDEFPGSCQIPQVFQQSGHSAYCGYWSIKYWWGRAVCACIYVCMCMSVITV